MIKWRLSIDHKTDLSIEALHDQSLSPVDHFYNHIEDVDIVKCKIISI